VWGHLATNGITHSETLICWEDEYVVAMTEQEHLRFEEIDERVKWHSHHAFLRQSQVMTSASRFHFDVGMMVLDAAHVSRQTAVSILEAVLLLQSGLSIHEHVDNVPELKRQLHVLAGDYCSSQYYWILSRLRDKNLMMALSESVIRVNEAKMTLYAYPSQPDSDRYMELQEVIQGDLLFTLARQFLSDASEWTAEIRSLVQAYIVKEAVVSINASTYFTLRQAYEWLSGAADRMMHKQANAILQPISTFLMDYLVPVKKSLEGQSLVEGNH
jgi:heptaprenyl diphosphate synthase